MPFLKQHQIRISLILITALSIKVIAIAEINTSSLIKLNAENKSQCVEYYIYNKQIYCTTTAFDTSSPAPNTKDLEKFHIHFDHRPWRIAWSKQTPISQTIEYIPFGEKINKWRELITS